MSRYKDEQCRICRRNGQKLFLKGERCYSDKCSINRRNYAPGQNGQKRAKLSEYGTQLREKQKAKAYYGVGEKQFRKYFEMAANSKEKTGDKLLTLLESRLDNVVYRLGFASSRAQARIKVNIPSFLVKPGDVISVREIEKENGAVKTAVEENEARPVPTWLEKEEGKLSGKVIKLASREDIDLPIEEHLIVEYYSK